MEGRDEEERDKQASAITRPPKGYTGSLRNTPWDPKAMLADFDAAQAQFDSLGG